MKKIYFILLIILQTVHSQAIFSEGFEDVEALVSTGGWVRSNQSSSPNLNWVHDCTVFGDGGAQSGTACSFAVGSYLSVNGAGTISNWLITPTIMVQNGDVITFYTRTVSQVNFPDRLEMRLNFADVTSNGYPIGAEGLGSFTFLAISVNPNLTTSDYPTAWTQYSYTVSGVNGLVPCRIGFRYYVTDGGTGANSDTVGIDTLLIERSLSIENFTNDNISICPNPCSSFIKLTNSEQVTNVSIMDIFGKVVLNVTNPSESINILDLSEGIYSIKIKLNDGSLINKRIIKE